MIQQFREAPSAYIFFVHDLIQNLVEFRECGIILDRIFQKLKDHFWPAMEMTEDGEVPTKNKCKLEVNIEIEHMALFYHDILKDSAISKIMKSAKQSLDEDKSTLQEYRIFINVLDMYRKSYIHCKTCFKNALIKQKFEYRDKHSQGVNGCSDNNCKNCKLPKQPIVKQDSNDDNEPGTTPE
jgi:hypothetical protein